VLLELGFLSNPDDEKLFSSEGWPKGEADTVARAIEGFLNGQQTAGQ
jgi:N-acetylmuramoyl-L-alanine amidase